MIRARLQPLDEKGLTLTEVTVVAVLGLLVIFGLIGFYLQSQATWLDASSQTITQREATMLARTVADSVRVSSSAVVTASPDADHSMISLVRKPATTAHYHYWWDSGDSLVHQGTDTGAGDRGPVTQSRVERFAITATGALVTVQVRLRSPQGQRVDAFAGAALVNR